MEQIRYKVRGYHVSADEKKRIRIVVKKLSEGVYWLYFSLPNRQYEFLGTGSDGKYNCICSFSNDEQSSGFSVELAIAESTSGQVVGNVMKDYFIGVYTDSDVLDTKPNVFSRQTVTFENI